jgi:hypothetical protein
MFVQYNTHQYVGGGSFEALYTLTQRCGDVVDPDVQEPQSYTSLIVVVNEPLADEAEVAEFLENLAHFLGYDPTLIELVSFETSADGSVEIQLTVYGYTDEAVSAVAGQLQIALESTIPSSLNVEAVDSGCYQWTTCYDCATDSECGWCDHEGCIKESDSEQSCLTTFFLDGEMCPAVCDACTGDLFTSAQCLCDNELDCQCLKESNSLLIIIFVLGGLVALSAIWYTVKKGKKLKAGGSKHMKGGQMIRLDTKNGNHGFTNLDDVPSQSVDFDSQADFHSQSEFNSQAGLIDGNDSAHFMSDINPAPPAMAAAPVVAAVAISQPLPDTQTLEVPDTQMLEPVATALAIEEAAQPVR